MPLSEQHRQIVIDWCIGEVSLPWGDLTALDLNWLCPEEGGALAGMRFSKRRREWLSGRWTAKRLLLRALPFLADKPMTEICIENHTQGYPLVMVDGQPLMGCLSISHRSEQAAAAYTPNEDIQIGIDLEWIEERHPAFLQDYFTDDEIGWVNAAPPEDQIARTTLMWSAKEAALKALRLGLAVDTHMIGVYPDMERDMEGWRILNYRSNLLEEGYRLMGWWQQRGNYMITLAVHLPIGETPSFCLQEIYLSE